MLFDVPIILPEELSSKDLLDLRKRAMRYGVYGYPYFRGRCYEGYDIFNRRVV